MPDNEIVKVKVTGDFACFTRPDLKVERMSYPCMTPSAARGILDSILWKPEFKWWVRSIKILKPIVFLSLTRNEINSKQTSKPIEVDLVDKNGKPMYRAQRNSIVLKDVSYLIEASIYQDKNDDSNPPKKYVEMFRRRVRKGQCWRRPYLGTREFAAEFFEPDGTEQPIKDTMPIGSMLFDIFYDEKGKPTPLFFHDVAIIKGVLACPDNLNLKMMHSSHIRPELKQAISSVIYDFNLNEKMEE
ncbi:MAG: type I-C CRISPR-associated protein Cas5 [Candidatus Methanofastidiosa archaeon]|nr:type I-C CRISPR-associated protein Cas5 [Candidatus Methanofastidiosa archaeon]